MKINLVILYLIIVFGAVASATPSTQVWNPSTDIQAKGSWHLGIDNYYTLKGPAEGGYAFPTDVGLTYGLLPGLEVGIDVFLPQREPFYFNAKYGIAETEMLPAFALGGFGFGTEKDVTDQNILYAVIAKTFFVGRFSVGYFSGNEKVLLDPEGEKDPSGVILTWDKAISDKLWVCADYSGSRSALGSFFYGFSWAFASNVSVIFGYGTYNNGVEPTATVQLDINI